VKNFWGIHVLMKTKSLPSKGKLSAKSIANELFVADFNV
jgi:hypothetical protein